MRGMCFCSSAESAAKSRCSASAPSIGGLSSACQPFARQPAQYLESGPSSFFSTTPTALLLALSAALARLIAPSASSTFAQTASALRSAAAISELVTSFRYGCGSTACTSSARRSRSERSVSTAPLSASRSNRITHIAAGSALGTGSPFPFAGGTFSSSCVSGSAAFADLRPLPSTTSRMQLRTPRRWPSSAAWTPSRRSLRAPLSFVNTCVTLPSFMCTCACSPCRSQSTATEPSPSLSSEAATSFDASARMCSTCTPGTGAQPVVTALGILLRSSARASLAVCPPSCE
mmetsp:Transcript_20684/g.52779  ORF Transcript_20684/g.52779 Transcript_20684/m.52779 type:complete len:290 (+) Transcript_20684:983-1852(+)